MDMHEKLKQAGFNPPQMPKKIDSSRANMKMKVIKAEEFLNNMKSYEERLHHAQDKDLHEMIENSVVLNYERFCESIKDILDNIAVRENIKTLSKRRGLGELIRTVNAVLEIDGKVDKAVRKLTTRNDAVHDYLNSEYYDNIVLEHVENDMEDYRVYLSCIKKYLADNNMIK